MLQLNPSPFLFGFLLFLIIFLHTFQEPISALKVLNMLSTHINSPGKNLALNFIYNDANSRLGNTVDFPSFAMVTFVGISLPRGMWYDQGPDQGPNLCFPHWQADSYPRCHEGSPHLVLICISLVTLFTCLLAICIFFFPGCLLKPFAHFLTRLFAFVVVVSCRNCIYIQLDIHLLLDIGLAKVFWQLFVCLFLAVFSLHG